MDLGSDSDPKQATARALGFPQAAAAGGRGSGPSRAGGRRAPQVTRLRGGPQTGQGLGTRARTQSEGEGPALD